MKKMRFEFGFTVTGTSIVAGWRIAQAADILSKDKSVSYSS